MVILPSVRVPVLSLQITEADPRVSTAASLRTKTCCLTMSLQPMDREMVTHSGMPSGMAATARVTAISTMYSAAGLSGESRSFRCSTTPMMKTTTHTTMARMPILAPSCSRFLCSGVWFADVSGRQKHFFFGPSSPAMSCAMRPIRVPMPVAVTMPRPLPFVTLQPEKTQTSGVNFSGSPSFLGFSFHVLETSSGSPVSAISLTFRSSDSARRMSAGTTSPVPRTTTSPRTTWLVGICTSCPSRTT
mmetsp:Transcript_5158/g.12276  ORF Transcript_5158/g.12276 Transcript_5158/m.12276 type:complete len:246 (-) Transcript_5158:425-1162(-)